MRQLFQWLQLSVYLCLEPVFRSLGCGTAVPAAAAVWHISVYNWLSDPLAVGQLFQLLQLSDIFVFRTGCQIPWLWDNYSSCCSCLISFCLESVVRSRGCERAVPMTAAVCIFVFRTDCQIPWLWDNCSSCCSCLIYLYLEPVVRSPWLWDSCFSCCSCLIYFYLEKIVRSPGCGTAVPGAGAVWYICLFRTGCQIPWLWDSCSRCWSCLIYFCLEPVVRSLGCGTAVPAAAAV